MGRKSKPLSDGELEIVRLLWERGGLTLSAAHQAMLDAGRDVGYTTVQTRLERLVEKKVVAKSRQRPAEYTAKIDPDSARGSMVDAFLNRVSGVVPLFAHLVRDPSVSAEDLREMRRMIDDAERRLGPGDQGDGA
ncbi:MAG: BlaI/MecI/CopY family transcriptional regulator [Pirellulales bacterium]